MVTRKIKVLSTLGMSGVIETNVSTLGQLKPLLRDREINTSGMKLMVGETRNELNLDEAILPEGDFKLYLMPSKTKSGSSPSYYSNRIADKFNELADLFESLGNSLDSASIGAKNSSTKSVKVDPDMEDLMNLTRGNSSFYTEEDDDGWDL